MQAAPRHVGVEMLQKGRAESLFSQRSTRPPSQATEMSDTDFEDDDDDISDFEEYSGRRSEESFGNQSNTTASTFEELRTPASNDFSSFNFQLRLEENPKPMKPVEGPVGPHLFRISQESSQEPDVYLEWSPVSPEEYRAGPQVKELARRQSRIGEAPPSSVPLESWTPEQVVGWMISSGFNRSLVEKFYVNDISGPVLKDLQFGNLKELGIESFGQRHQVWDKIRNLKGALSLPSSPETCSPDLPNVAAGPSQPSYNQSPNESPNECSPDESKPKGHHGGRRRARRALRPDDVISPGESASIVAIEQLLPKPHVCSKGENCKTWRKQQKMLARIAKEFPLEMEQIEENNASPSEITIRPTSEAVPSVVASSDLLGQGRLPALRINEEALRVVQTRDPQENVRQFISFQHLNEPAEEPTTPPYEMFPPLSPPANTQAPHGNLSRLPKLTIPAQAQPQDAFSPNRTIRPAFTPVTAMHYQNDDIYRFGSPASAMDVPVTAIPTGPIARDESQSVPPDMRFGQHEPISRSTSRAEHRQPWSPIEHPRTAKPMEHSVSRSASRRQPPAFAMPAVEERNLTPIGDEQTPTVNDINHAGWMKKRKTKMLRHEWHEKHFRLNGTRLAMHSDSKAMDALEFIDVDEFAVACSSIASNKLNTAFKSLKMSGKKDKSIASAFEFQLVPAAEKKGVLSAATGKTHHFAVKTQDERIDWMRELMLAKALRQKADGCEININGNMI